MQFPSITPAVLSRVRDPFDHPDWIFELKYDGFRAVAYIDHGSCRLVSRNGHTFKSWPGLCERVGEAISGHTVILDGEIVCLDGDGKPQFNALLYRRFEPCYAAFDCLWLDRRDLRGLTLLERKEMLRSLMPPQPSPLFYVNHVPERGTDLFRAVCEQDLEGIVAKWAHAPYGTEPPSWIKVKNRDYSQAVGRRELFERRRPAKSGR